VVNSSSLKASTIIYDSVLFVLVILKTLSTIIRTSSN